MEHRHGTADRSASDLLRLGNVCALDRVDVVPLVSGHTRHENLIAPGARVLAAQTHQCGTIERPVRRLAHGKRVERRPRRVQRVVEDARGRADEELLLVDSVLLAQRGVLNRRRLARVDVDLAGLDLEQGLLLSVLTVQTI